MLTAICLTAQVDLTSNLKVCMPFGGNANDLSGSGNNGIVSNATLTTDRFGNANSAYHFDNTLNSHIAINSFSTIASTNELTISMWAKADITTSNCLFALSPDNQNDRCVGCAQYSDAGSTMMVWDYGDIILNGGRATVPSIPIDNTGWHHYVFVVSQSGNVKFTYLDGTMNFNDMYNSSCSNKNLPFYIGGGFSNGTSSKIMWNGKIDDVTIYNRMLSSNEVSALYSVTSLCPTTNVHELASIGDLAIYPTVSADGRFNLHSNKAGEKSLLEVYSPDGKLVYRTSELLYSKIIDLSETAAGIYLVKLITPQGVYTKKVVRQ